MDGLTMRTMMGGLSPQDLMPKVDYGQGAGKAWSPSTRSEVYQQADKAREQITQGGGISRITAVAGHILTHQDDFARALFNELLRFVDQLRHGKTA